MLIYGELETVRRKFPWGFQRHYPCICVEDCGSALATKAASYLNFRSVVSVPPMRSSLRPLRNIIVFTVHGDHSVVGSE
jgi:hypothetical protein